VPTVGGANLLLPLGPMDQRAIPIREDYLRFESAPLARAVAIAGPVTLTLWAATDGPDTDFMAKLVDVYPDGYEAIVLDGPLRARYRFGRRPEDVRMMEPGKAEKLVIDLWQTALTFEAGHKVALHVTSSNSPRFEVNPNNGSAPGGDPGTPRIAINTIYVDRAHASELTLPVLLRE
jgi:putative CocE/NonD family hydrolase